MMQAIRILYLAVLLQGLAFFTCSAADLGAAVRAVQVLGKEGIDNQAASRAWETLSQAEPTQLTVLLSGLDEANPLGANYLRAAVDTVVDRTLKTGRPAPLGPLEQFIRQTTHSSRARRLAFEVLARFDPTAPDRLVPGFIDDPSTELRRDAVDRLIVQGRRELGEGATDAAKRQAGETFQAAFRGARDLDQIELLTVELKKLGVAVDLPRHFGFILDWKLIGPFDNTNESAFDVVYPPEKEIRLDAVYAGKAGKQVKWIDHSTKHEHGLVDFNNAIGKANGVVGYAFCEFYSPDDREVDFRTGCICAFKLWVNGQLVDARHVYHSGTKIDQYIARGKLKAGKNEILVKVLQNEQTENWAQDWQFQLRVCDSVGTAVLSNTGKK